MPRSILNTFILLAVTHFTVLLFFFAFIFMKKCKINLKKGLGILKNNVKRSFLYFFFRNNLKNYLDKKKSGKLVNVDVVKNWKVIV